MYVKARILILVHLLGLSIKLVSQVLFVWFFLILFYETWSWFRQTLVKLLQSGALMC